MTGRTQLPSGLVTFMFTDIEGSTRMARMLGEGYGGVLNAHRDLLRAALRNHSGVELFTEGDSFFVAFSNAADAVAACVASQRALAAFPWPSREAAPRVRMGVHTGWAQPRGDEYASTEVHRAARVAAAAHGGQILCSESTALAVTTWSSDLQPKPRKSENSRVTDEAGNARASEEAETAREDVLRTLDLLDLGPHTLRGFDDSERLFQVVAPGLDRSFPRPRTPNAPAHNLPSALTPFLGRQAELAELRDVIGSHRLVTVVGGGGAGKSRLALAAAFELRAAYPRGVWFVDLVEPGDAERALAAAMGVRSEPGRPIVQSVLERCGDERVLVVLDTCDARPAEAKRLIRRLIAACPRLDVLATSRAPVGVPGELVWRIPPLAPADAYALLVARAEAARGRTTMVWAAADQGGGPEHEETTDLGRVAARLDGHPLALELAADRLRLLTAAQLTARLDDPIAALDAGRLDPRRLGNGGMPAGADDADPAARHDSLTENLDWSYRALSAPAAELLRRLAVFAGPVELGTVEWSGGDAFGALSELADRSLVEVVSGPHPRYRLTGQVRAYASRRLSAAGEERAARDRHVGWALHTLDGVAVDTDGQPRTVSLTELSPYVREWEAALRWSAAGGSARLGMRLAGALDPWWREHGGARSGRELLNQLYSRQEVTGERIDDRELASTYLVHAGLSVDREERGRFLQRAEALATGDPALTIRALAGRRVTLIESGNLEAAEQVCRDVIGRAERSGVPAAGLPSIVALAELLLRRDALDEAAELLGGARMIEAGRPEDRGRRTVDWLLGLVALRRGDLVAAHDHLVVALRSRLRHGFRGAAADAVAAIAARCTAGGDLETAAVLFGGAESVRGARRATQFGSFWAAQQATLRRELGDCAFDAAYAEGAERGFSRAVASALAVEHPDLERGSARFAQTMG